MGYKIHQMDVDNAFLQAMLNKEVYMTQPEGFMDPNQPNHICHLKQALYSLKPDKPNHVCCLCHSLYSLKQALLTWNQTLDKYLCTSSFVPVELDPCVYIKGMGHDLLL